MAKNVGSKAAEVVKSMDVDLSRLGSVGFENFSPSRLRYCWLTSACFF